MKKMFSKLVTLALVLALCITALPAENAQASTKTQLQAAYERVMNYAGENGIVLGMTYEDFRAGYQGQGIAKYEQSYYNALVVTSIIVPGDDSEPVADNSVEALVPRLAQKRIDLGGAAVQSASSSSSSSSSGGSKYYYNTGTSCPASATYSKYKLLSVVQKGDIIFEANGGLGITGHIAIVEGIYTRSDGTKYIRLIEAIDKGVVRSILDDTRCDDKAVTILRVKSVTSTQINNAVSFCVGELGSKYSLDFAKDTSSSETDWYCSELVWAAYKNQGIDLEVTSGINEPGITPRDIKRSSKVKTISY